MPGGWKRPVIGRVAHRGNIAILPHSSCGVCPDLRFSSRQPSTFVLTVALTWPLILHPGGRVPNDLGDPLLNTWLMAWNARVLPLTEKWWNAPQFFPVAGAMAFSEHLLGLSWITTPVIWLSGNPLLGYNAAFFLSFPLCALSAYFLTYSIARRHDCAFVAGLAFGFAPYRMAQFAHVQVLSAYWMPLALAGLHRYFRGPPRPLAGAVRGRLVHAGAGVRLLPVLPVGARRALAAVVPRRTRALAGAVARRPRRGPRRPRCWRPSLYGYWTYQHAYGMRRWPDEIISFSADVASVLKAPYNLRLWGWLDVVDHPESALVSGDHADPPDHRGAGDRLEPRGEGTDRVAADRARAGDCRPGLRGRRGVAGVLRSVEDRDRGAAPAVGGHAAQAAVDRAAALRRGGRAAPVGARRRGAAVRR